LGRIGPDVPGLAQGALERMGDHLCHEVVIAHQGIVELVVPHNRLDQVVPHGPVPEAFHDIGGVPVDHLPHFGVVCPVRHLINHQKILFANAGAITFVEGLDDLRERSFLLLCGRVGTELADGLQGCGFAGVQRGIALVLRFQSEGGEGQHVVGDRDIGRDIAGRQQAREPGCIDKKFFQRRIVQRDDLGDEGIEALETPQELAELFLLCLVLVKNEPLPREADDAFEGRAIRFGEVAGEETVGEAFNLAPVDVGCMVNALFEVVELVGVGAVLKLRGLEEGREGLPDVFGRVAEVENEGVLLARPGAVQAGECLHRMEACEFLVDIHGDEFRLVEPGLVFLGDDKDLVFRAVEPAGQFGRGEAVRARLGPCVAVDVEIAGEGDQGPDVGVFPIRDVSVQALPVAQGVFARPGHDHRLCLTVEFPGDVATEVFDDHLDLPFDGGRVQRGITGDTGPGLASAKLRIVLDGLFEPVIGLIGRVVPEHVQNEAFLDCLTHGIEVEGVGFAVGTGVAEAFQCDVAGCCGEGEEGDVLLRSPRLLEGQNDILDMLGIGGGTGGGIGGGTGCLAGQRAAHGLCRLARLRGMGLVDNDREVPVGLARDGGEVFGAELLDRRDDDPRALKDRRFQIAGCAVDLPDHAFCPGEAADGVLQLPVQNQAIGHDDCCIEARSVVRVVQVDDAVGDPGDGGGLAGAGTVLDQVVLSCAP